MNKLQYLIVRFWLNKNNFEFERTPTLAKNGFQIVTENDGHGNYKPVFMKTWCHFKSFRKRYNDLPSFMKKNTQRLAYLK